MISFFHWDVLVIIFLNICDMATAVLSVRITRLFHIFFFIVALLFDVDVFSVEILGQLIC